MEIYGAAREFSGPSVDPVFLDAFSWKVEFMFWQALSRVWGEIGSGLKSSALSRRRRCSPTHSWEQLERRITPSVSPYTPTMVPVPPILSNVPASQPFTNITINFNQATINEGSISFSNIIVSNGYAQATVVNAYPIGVNSVTYQIMPPGGLWADSPQGTYTVSVLSGYSPGGVKGIEFQNRGNQNAGSFLVDTNAPHGVFVSPDQGNTTNASQIVFQVQFTEPVFGLSSKSISLAGTAGATTAFIGAANAQNTLYDVFVSGMTKNGTVIPTILAGAGSDMAGNPTAPVTLSGSPEYYYDTTPPTASLASAPNVLSTAAGSHTASVTVNYSDSTGVGVNPATFATSNITVSNGSTHATVTGVSHVGNAVTYTIQSPAATWGASAQGTYVIGLTAGAGGVKDAVGNSVVANASLGSFQVSTVPLTVTINQAASQANQTTAATINFTVAFSKPVSNFTTGDVTLGGTAGATTATVTPAQAGGLLWNVAVSGMQSAGTVTATIAPGVANSATGNLNTASTSTDNTVTYAPPMTTMYRLYNPNAGLHVYTTSTSEYTALVKLGYTDETPQTTSFQVMTIQLAGATPVLRVYNPIGGQHYLTLSSVEENALVQVGWVAESNQGYLYPSAKTGTIPIYQLYNTSNGDHLYTVSPSELAALLKLPTTLDPWIQSTTLGYGFAASAAAVQAPLISSTTTTDVLPPLQLSVSPAIAPEKSSSNATPTAAPLPPAASADSSAHAGQSQFAAETSPSTTALDAVWKEFGTGQFDRVFQNAA